MDVLNASCASSSSRHVFRFRRASREPSNSMVIHQYEIRSPQYAAEDLGLFVSPIKPWIDAIS